MKDTETFPEAFDERSARLTWSWLGAEGTNTSSPFPSIAGRSTLINDLGYALEVVSRASIVLEGFVSKALEMACEMPVATARKASVSRSAPGFFRNTEQCWPSDRDFTRPRTDVSRSSLLHFAKMSKTSSAVETGPTDSTAGGGEAAVTSSNPALARRWMTPSRCAAPTTPTILLWPFSIARLNVPAIVASLSVTRALCRSGAALFMVPNRFLTSPLSCMVV
mmetsp:Transcript_8463/g.16411  ORF Transcript_8463/g.16411 Transcript_8463/m.16411 type:complete len:222 (+) Transcript_8463:658-1323(+)